MGRNRPRKLERGGIYHFGSRGSNRQLIYVDAVDYQLWRMLLDRVVRRYGWVVLDWTQMPNHFHVLARIPELSLAAGMQALNDSYSRRSNARHGRSQHLFANRFWSELVETPDQLLTAIGYIDVNSYKAQRRVRPRDWPHGGYRALAGYSQSPTFLAVDELLSVFDRDRAKAVVRYRDFVAEAMARVDRVRSQARVTEL